MVTMMEMEHNPSWASQSPSPLPFPSPYVPISENSEKPLQLIYGLNDPGVYQTEDLNSKFPDTNLSPLSLPELDADSPTECSGFISYQINLKNEHEVYQTALFPDPTMYPLVTSPEVDSDSPTGSHGLISQHINSTIQSHNALMSVKRRMQNREAQRRFRERREEQQKSLHQKTVDLQEKYQKLSNECNQKSDEVSQLLRENNALKSEIQSLRQQWRTMTALLQRPKSLQTLCVLFAGEPPLMNKSSCSHPEPDLLDDYMRCLEALLLLPNEKTHCPNK